jgi:methanesulfonate monooxygenase subunit beta
MSRETQETTATAALAAGLVVGGSVREAIADTIHAAALALDDLDFEGFLALTAPELRYRIEAYSPEIRKSMTWLDHDRASLAGLIELLPRHHVDSAQWLRLVSVARVTSGGPRLARAVSSVAFYHTVVDVGDVHVDGGSSRLFAIGRYHDELVLDGGRWLLAERRVKLATRQLGIGTHLLP